MLFLAARYTKDVQALLKKCTLVASLFCACFWHRLAKLLESSQRFSEF